MNTTQDSIRDLIAEVRFSRRKIASGNTDAAEREYMEHCLSKIRWLFASRHSLRPNRYGELA